MNVTSLVLAWANNSQRVYTMAAELGGKASLQYEAKLAGRYWLLPLRYLVQGWKTWRLLEQERPEVVIVQNPPIFASLTVALWCWWRGNSGPSGRRASYVIDAHTASFHHPSWRWSHPLLRFLSRRAVATLVTDNAALDTLGSWGARGIFLVNALPTLSPPTGLIGSEGEERVAVISIFDSVEPIEEVFAAARLLPQVSFYVTGDPKRAPSRLLKQKPENVTLTG